MNVEAHVRRFQRLIAVLCILMFIEMGILGAVWLFTGSANGADEPVGLPVKAPLGSKDNPVECLYAKQIMVLSDDGRRAVVIASNDRYNQSVMGEPAYGPGGVIFLGPQNDPAVQIRSSGNVSTITMSPQDHKDPCVSLFANDRDGSFIQVFNAKDNGFECWPPTH